MGLMNNFLNGIDLSADKTEEEFFTDLVARAMAGKQSDFEFIRSWQERTTVKTYQIGLAAIIRIFTNLCDSTYRVYLSQIKTGSQDLKTLLALKQFKQCLVFYKREYEIVADMVEEYWEYIWNWHIIDTLIGNYRAEEDLWDHRGNNPNGK
jgi:uncharacterized protein YozE (UPF0346 family)